ncbi:TPA: alkanesulfonate monooxygenase, partial [Acinetobacter baumannii]
EESIRFAELVFPLLPIETRAKLAQPNLTGPFGEIIANNYVPDEKKQNSSVKEPA